MKNRYYNMLLAVLIVFVAVCLIPAASFAQENTDKGAADEKTATAEGRKMDSEAQAALQEAQRRYETNPEDLAAVREPLINYLASPPADRLTPDTLYQMLGQFWYIDEKNDKRVEEARKIYKLGWEAFPDDDGMLLNYAVTTYEFANETLDKDNVEAANTLFVDSGRLFEKYYEVMPEKDIKYLEYAAQTYYQAENLEEAKRVFVKMIGLTETPKDNWLLQTIGICQAQDDSKEEEKYIRLALDYFPMEKKYWKLLANASLAKAATTNNDKYYTEATAAFEIATRVELPDSKSDWRTLIDLYNFLGLPLRSAEATQEGLDMLAKDSTEEEQQLAIAEAYARGARVDKAVSFLDGCIAKNPSYELKLKKATILYDARRNEEALAALDDCIAAKSNAYEAYYRKGWIAWDMKKWEMAKAAFGEAANSREDTIRFTSENALEMLASLDQARSE